MTTVINTPSTNTDDGSAVAIVFGIIIIAALGVLFYVYALPQLRGTTAPTTSVIKVELPAVPKTTPAQ